MAFNEGSVDATSWFDGTLALPLRALFGPRGLLPLTGAAASVDDEPLRAQLFTAEEMEHHGRHLAAGHELTPSTTPRPSAAPDSPTNERTLDRRCTLLAQSADERAASHRPANGCSTTST